MLNTASGQPSVDCCWRGEEMQRTPSTSLGDITTSYSYGVTFGASGTAAPDLLLLSGGHFAAGLRTRDVIREAWGTTSFGIALILIGGGIGYAINAWDDVSLIYGRCAQWLPQQVMRAGSGPQDMLGSVERVQSELLHHRSHKRC